MGHNWGMQSNLRLFFSILWLVSMGFALATGLAFVITWGGYAEYFVASLILLGISSAGCVITSL